MLRKAQKFYAGDVENLPEFKWRSLSDPETFPMLPFSVTAIEFISGHINAIAVLTEGFVSEKKHGVVTLNLFWKTEKGAPFMPIGMIDIDRHGGKNAARLLPSHFFPMDPSDERTSNLCALLTEDTCRFLQVLNCVNVRTEEVPAPAALNKKRAKSGKPPIYSYKTLVLRPNAAKRVDGGGTHDSPRIHLRRGHIKHRKTGNFWWQPCVVGDRAKGVVMKDYRADKLTAPADTRAPRGIGPLAGPSPLRP
jgi:hypothetical protein